MKKRRLSVLSSLVLAALSCSANAEEDIYAQLPKSSPPKPYDSFEAADAVSGQLNDQMTADNFILTDSDAIITGLTWWGGSDNENTSDLDNFSSITVKIFTYPDYAPDGENVLYSETFRMNETNPTYIGFAAAEAGALVYKHRITFSKPLDLCRGDEYWISIGATNVSLASTQLNITTSKNGYMWYSAGTAADGNIWIFNFSDILSRFLSPEPAEWFEADGDQAFILHGDKTTFLRATHCPDHSGSEPTDTPEPTDTQEPTPTATISIAPTPTATPTPPEVPIPAAVWLFGSGLAGLFAVARKRKPKS